MVQRTRSRRRIADMVPVRAREQLPSVRRVEYHPLESMDRCAEGLRRRSEFTATDLREANLHARISSNVSELHLESTRPLGRRFLELVRAART